MRLQSLALGVVVCAVATAVPVAVATPVDPFENMLGDVEDEEDYLELINLLDAAVKEPVNLLDADREEISRLPWISPLLADRIVALALAGELRSPDDLTKIAGIDERMVDLLRPFVTVRSPRKLVSPVTGLARMRIISSPVSSSYRKHKTYLRFGLGWNDQEGGFVVEKDRDESSLNDFQSYYLTGRWRWGEAVAGNFTLASGHGLVFSNPYGHSPSTVSPWRFSRGDFRLKPYTSVDENFTMQGAGLKLEGRRLAVCVAVSRSYFDAGLDEDGRVKTLKQTGYHVSTSDLEGEDALREDLLAFAADYDGGVLGIRANLSYADFSRDFSPEFSRGTPEALSRHGNLVGSVDLSLSGSESMLFAEVATTREGREAMLGGLAFDRSPVSLLMLGRLYDDRFLSLHARPFAFYSGVGTGERGLFAQLTLKPIPAGRVAIGSDLHRKRGKEGAVSDPSGSESFLNLEWSAGDLTLSLGEKLLRSETPPEGEGDLTEKKMRLRSRLDARYEVTRSMWLRARYELLRAETDAGTGRERSSSDLLRLDGGIGIGKIAEVKAGVSVFTIGDYASRIYQYEPGLPYYPTLEMLKSDGTRWYSIVSLRGEAFGGLTAKYGRTAYSSDDDRSAFMFYYSLKI
ncbi:MAG: helix-hairpin-helix domain-containing protein [Candidatus Eisenbacteria bacterium]